MPMEPKKEYNKKFEPCITSLSNERENLERRVTSYRVISEKIFRDIVEQIDCIFRKHLRDLFGEECKPDQNWFCEEFLNFRGEPGESTEELVFAFWGCDGTESYSKKGKPTPFLRENIYLRGTRWEDEKKRSQFYKNFREIKFLFKNYVPVDFFGCLAKGCPPVLRIAIEKQPTDKIPTIVIPLGETFVQNFTKSSYVHKLVEHINECSRNEQKEIDVETIKQLWDKIRKTKEINESQFINGILKQFETAKVIFPSEGEYTPNEIVFMVATSFQYYS